MSFELPQVDLPAGHGRVLYEFLSSGPSLSEAMVDAVKDLPTLTESQIISLGHKDSVCAICFNTFLAILAEQEMAEAMNSPTHAVEELGVTRLSQDWQCGHLFCRKDITKWIQEGKKTCPTCRRPIAKPGTDTADTGDQSPPVVVDLDSNELLQDFITRMSEIAPSPARPTRNEREFSGMYS